MRKTIGRINPVRRVVLTALFIITALLLGVALLTAVYIGFGEGIRGMYARSLPQITGSLVRHPRVVLMAMIVLLFIFLMAAGSWIDRLDRKGCIAAAAIMTAVLLGLQLWVVFGLNIIQNTDSFEVQDQAMSIAKGFMQSVDYEKSAYFRKYGNNDLYLILCIGMYRLCGALHIAHWDKFFVLFNTFCIDAGIIMGCGVIAVVRNRRAALRAYLFNVLNPMNYLFLHWTYTCTYSIPLMLLSVCLFVYIRRHRERTAGSAVCFVLIGLTGVVGYFLRPTSVFPIIAILLCVLLDHLPGTKKRPEMRQEPDAMQKARMAKEQRTKRKPETKQNPEGISGAKRGPVTEAGGSGKTPPGGSGKASAGKRAVCRIAVLLITVCVMAAAAGLIKTDAARYDTNNEYNFPIEHWLMVGMSGNGRLTSEDMEYTAGFKTKAEKKAADIAAMKEAIEERGTLGNVVFCLEKIGVSWSDGTDEYYTRTTQSENSRLVLYQLVSGARRGALMIYCQAFRIILLFLAILGIGRAVRHGVRDDIFAVFTITVLGGLVFYMFWEGKPVYSLPFMPFLAFLGCDAWNPMSRTYYHSIETNRTARWTERTIVAMVIALVLAAFGSDSRRVLNRQIYTEWSIVCSSPAIMEKVELEPGDTMEQEFYPAYSFNRIRLVAEKTDGAEKEKNTDGRDCSYEIILSCEDRELCRFEVTDSLIRGRKMVLSFDEITPAKGEKYTLTIRNVSESGNSISWGVRKCYLSSQYRGERYLNGTAQIADTLMDVYMTYGR